MSRRQYKRRAFKKIKRDKRKVRARRQKRANPFPAMPIYRIHTREISRIRVYDRNGNLRKAALKQFNMLIRCYKKNVVIPINYRLLVEMYQAWLYFGQPQVTVFSGCRPKETSPGSRHTTGDAVDFNLDGIPRRRLVQYYLKRNKGIASYKLGVGYYPESYHVHLDIRKRHAFWVQLVRENGTGYYASNPYSAFFKSAAALAAHQNRVS